MNKLIWYPITKKTYTHKKALNYAKARGLRLPTVEEIKEAIKNKEDLGKVSFWSSEVHPDGPEFAFVFLDDGYILSDNRDFGLSVRCVETEKEKYNKEFKNKLDNLINE